jgi:hypothetical protein
MDEAARWQVGGTLAGARLICAGEKRVLQLGGGLHHAQRNNASGFCVYNDLAIAIHHLARHGLWVAYLDVDVHHGDGVQQILYEDKRVMTISLHESGQYLFPGTGATHELGAGLGRGLKLNVPLEPFTEGESYLEVFDRVVPAAFEQFKPAVLVVQAGADAHFDDPLADLLLTTRDYEAIFRRVLAVGDSRPEPSLVKAGQSNTSVAYGEQLILKLFRRVEAGVNPDLEIGRFLTQRGFGRAPAVCGALEYRRSGSDAMTLAILHSFVTNQGDAWRYTVEALSRYFEQAQAAPEEARKAFWSGLRPLSTGTLVGLADLPQHLPATLGLTAGRTIHPGVVAAAADVQHLAHHRQLKPLPLLMDPAEPHGFWLAK